jgi:hypothetical protein
MPSSAPRSGLRHHGRRTESGGEADHVPGSEQRGARALVAAHGIPAGIRVVHRADAAEERRSDDHGVGAAADEGDVRRQREACERCAQQLREHAGTGEAHAVEGVDARRVRAADDIGKAEQPRGVDRQRFEHASGRARHRERLPEARLGGGGSGGEAQQHGGRREAEAETSGGRPGGHRRVRCAGERGHRIHTVAREELGSHAEPAQSVGEAGVERAAPPRGSPVPRSRTRPGNGCANAGVAGTR